MKTTAVEWLEEMYYPEYLPKVIIEKAKEMEKQQIIDAGNSCALMQHIHEDRVNQMSIDELYIRSEEDNITFGEQYYNETFRNLQGL